MLHTSPQAPPVISHTSSPGFMMSTTWMDEGWVKKTAASSGCRPKCGPSDKLCFGPPVPALMRRQFCCSWGVKIKKPPVLAANPVSDVPPSHLTPQLQLQTGPLKLPQVWSGSNLWLKEHVSKKDVWIISEIQCSAIARAEQGTVIWPWHVPVSVTSRSGQLSSQGPWINHWFHRGTWWAERVCRASRDTEKCANTSDFPKKQNTAVLWWEQRFGWFLLPRWKFTSLSKKTWSNMCLIRSQLSWMGAGY